MLLHTRTKRSIAVAAVAAGSLSLGVLASTTALASSDHAQGAGSAERARHNRAFGVNEVDLVSSIPGRAAATDPDLKNPWGVALSDTSPLWTSNAGTDTSTLYTSAPGSSTAAKVPTVRVTLPKPPFIPTGQVFNGGTGFVIHSADGATQAPARFIFAGISGQIAAWAPPVTPAVGEAQSVAAIPGASFSGLAIATARTGDQIYAANFAQGKITVFDTNFKEVATKHGQFQDRLLPKGFVPFNVQALSGHLFVAYAKLDPSTHQLVETKGAGLVDEYTNDGALVDRIVTGQTLNAPWGLAIAPEGWGKLTGSLLVGNFGDGKINVVPPRRHGGFSPYVVSQLRDNTTGKVLSIERLWSLQVGTATTGGTDSIWFTAGINAEQDGLLGVLRRN
jgi:uncharacterized protein (TIGR03118 family)